MLASQFRSISTYCGWTNGPAHESPTERWRAQVGTRLNGSTLLPAGQSEIARIIAMIQVCQALRSEFSATVSFYPDSYPDR